MLSVTVFKLIKMKPNRLSQIKSDGFREALCDLSAEQHSESRRFVDDAEKRMLECQNRKYDEW